MEHTVFMPTPQRPQAASKSKWSIFHICTICTFVLSVAVLAFCLAFHQAKYLTVCSSKAKWAPDSNTWLWRPKKCSLEWLKANNSTVEINITGFYMIHIQVSYSVSLQNGMVPKSQIELKVLCDGSSQKNIIREVFFTDTANQKKIVTLDASALLMKGNKIQLHIEGHTNAILVHDSLTFWEINAITGPEIGPSGHCTADKLESR
eukprot:XP_002934216.1 PREDICTED: uncharacterized protein LOC100493447 [Xenopus tropicalis]